MKVGNMMSYRLIAGLLILFAVSLTLAEPLSPRDLLNLKGVSSVQISPDGKLVAYTVSVPRAADDKPGGAYMELHVVEVKTGITRPFITGKVNVSAVQWTPDGQAVSFLMRRGKKARRQVWKIAIDGGEAVALTAALTDILAYQWHPSGKQLAYIATEPTSAREKKLKEMGYGFIFYEENLKDRNVYLLDLKNRKTKQLTHGKSAWGLKFSHDGTLLAVALTEKNLIDQSYMFKHVFLLDIKSGTTRQLTDNPGKLGNYSFSPDDKTFAYTAALDRKDNAVSQVFVLPVSGGTVKNLTPQDFKGHMESVAWKDNKTLLVQAGQGVFSKWLTINTKSAKVKEFFSSETNGGIVFRFPSFTKDFKHFAFVGTSPAIPSDLFYWPGKKAPRRLSNVNPWLETRRLGRQEAVQYAARDGLQIEGLLIYPLDYKKGQTYPLVVLVHGGPESHYSNGWLSRYSTPGQVLAGKGYLVFYPNYRASTGYGVDFAAQGYNDAAGKEFDDIADGIDYLINQGLADANRVGLGGGSYGGFASAWFATYYTKKVRAVCMFVGISDLISKRGTTDIPYEELYVHSGKSLEEMWQQSLERSPIYYAHQSRTATLIYGGAADPRVHPSQSLELYRRMKMNGHPAVRLVQYPGEGHGNRNQTGRMDVLYRILDWYDWYVKDAKALNGPMPALDISEKYGLDLPRN